MCAILSSQSLTKMICFQQAEGFWEDTVFLGRLSPLSQSSETWIFIQGKNKKTWDNGPIQL